MGWFSEAIFGKSDDAGSDERKAEVQPAAANPYRQASGGKVIPEVIVDHVNPHCSADMSHLELWIRLKNTSNFEVEVMEVRILGQSQGLNRFLKPGESHESCVYKGSVPTNDAQHVAQVDYKIVGNGDYFESDHQIDYRLEDDNGVHHFIPEELKLLRPIRDV
jgi:hypothetical protein